MKNYLKIREIILGLMATGAVAVVPQVVHATLALELSRELVASTVTQGDADDIDALLGVVTHLCNIGKVSKHVTTASAGPVLGGAPTQGSEDGDVTDAPMSLQSYLDDSTTPSNSSPGEGGVSDPQAPAVQTGGDPLPSTLVASIPHSDPQQTISTVPEPSVLALLGIGLMGIGVESRRKKRA